MIDLQRTGKMCGRTCHHHHRHRPLITVAIVRTHLVTASENNTRAPGLSPSSLYHPTFPPKPSLVCHRSSAVPGNLLNPSGLIIIPDRELGG